MTPLLEYVSSRNNSKGADALPTIVKHTMNKIVTSDGMVFETKPGVSGWWCELQNGTKIQVSSERGGLYYKISWMEKGRHLTISVNIYYTLEDAIIHALSEYNGQTY